MAGPGLRNAVVLTAMATLVALILRSLRSAPLPASATRTGGSAPSTTLSPATGEIVAVGGAATPEPPPVADTLPGLGGVDPLVAEGEPEVAATTMDLADWIEATDAEPPATHPVKARRASGIYHLPGGVSYARIRPDRWYRSAEAAEADGLRAAKR